MPASFDTVIIGAGNAGVSLAARLQRDGVRGIALIDPSPIHRYRPMLNYAAAGQARMSRYERPLATVVPDGVELIPHAATRVDPDARTVTLESGASVSYSDLVLCPGLTPHWDDIPGLQDAFVDGWAVSAHVPEYAGRACAALVREREGTVVFSVPPEPASCGGTVLKAMFLACDRWRRKEVLDRIDVHLVTPFGGLLGLEEIDARLQPFIEDYGITVHANTRVAAVDHRARTVSLDGPAPVTLEQVNLAYVTPHSRTPRFVAQSELATSDASALVDVDPRTLRHARFETVWGLGDAATVGTRPSGGALRDQVAVVADNLRAAREGGALTEYDGYTVIPVAVSRNRLVLDEHDRDGRPAPSVRGIDLTAPRRMTYVFDRFVQPVVYFRRLLRGRV
ncbi:NAD(P)/FAD-dependent oxidoreductase [Dietzia sp. B32]|uniref:NAD(P)/FAD-dependent oxidoreductase n=1 Tax=Dietzia sp. B32 TaxID=2915130 RepID=UPI0021AD5E69|nr:FAD/NAD(P)-binding oxidoreductase [Dietzia sp. B32]UVE96341.1 NAD(P)/FAD-dependent oxidoreductase [Dietzia sp. B32]